MDFCGFGVGLVVEAGHGIRMFWGLSGIFGIYPEISGFIRNSWDLSGILATYLEFSRLIRNSRDLPGILGIYPEFSRFYPEISVLIRKSRDLSGILPTYPQFPKSGIPETYQRQKNQPKAPAIRQELWIGPISTYFIHSVWKMPSLSTR